MKVVLKSKVLLNDPVKFLNGYSIIDLKFEPTNFKSNTLVPLVCVTILNKPLFNILFQISISLINLVLAKNNVTSVFGLVPSIGLSTVEVEVLLTLLFKHLKASISNCLTPPAAKSQFILNKTFLSVPRNEGFVDIIF